MALPGKFRLGRSGQGSYGQSGYVQFEMGLSSQGSWGSVMCGVVRWVLFGQGRVSQGRYGKLMPGGSRPGGLGHGKVRHVKSRILFNRRILWYTSGSTEQDFQQILQL